LKEKQQQKTMNMIAAVSLLFATIDSVKSIDVTSAGTLDRQITLTNQTVTVSDVVCRNFNGVEPIASKTLNAASGPLTLILATPNRALLKKMPPCLIVKT